MGLEFPPFRPDMNESSEVLRIREAIVVGREAELEKVKDYIRQKEAELAELDRLKIRAKLKLMPNLDKIARSVFKSMENPGASQGNPETKPAFRPKRAMAAQSEDVQFVEVDTLRIDTTRKEGSPVTEEPPTKRNGIKNFLIKWMPHK